MKHLVTDTDNEPMKTFFRTVYTNLYPSYGTLVLQTSSASVDPFRDSMGGQVAITILILQMR